MLDLAGHLRFTLPDSGVIWSSRGWLDGQPAPARRSPRRIVDATGRTVARVTGAPVAWSPDGGLLLFGRGHALLVGDPRDLARARTLLQSWAGGRCVVHAGQPLRLDQRQHGQADARPRGRRLRRSADSTSAAPSGHATGGWRTSATALADQPLRPGVTVPVFIADTHGRIRASSGASPSTITATASSPGRRTASACCS